MKAVNISYAKAHLSSLLRDLEDNNEEIVLERAGKPIARVVQYKKKNKVQIGGLKDQIKIMDDFDVWPDDIAKNLGMTD